MKCLITSHPIDQQFETLIFSNICEMNPESKKNYLEFGSGLWAYDDFNTEEDDQLWFDWSPSVS